MFERADRLDLRRTVLARLVVMGTQHNHWYVRDVVCDLLAGIDDASLAMLAADVIDERRDYAAWHAEQALKRRLKRPIADALRRAKASAGTP